jgi:hypothetical protein
MGWLRLIELTPFASADTPRSPASRLLQNGCMPAGGSVKADAKLQERAWSGPHPDDCGGSATWISTDSTPSPASRLLQIGPSPASRRLRIGVGLLAAASRPTQNCGSELGLGRIRTMTVAQRRWYRLIHRLRQQAGSYRMGVCVHTAALKPMQNCGSELGLGRIRTIAVGQPRWYRLIRRLRQQAGSYRSVLRQQAGSCGIPFAGKRAPTVIAFD